MPSTFRSLVASAALIWLGAAGAQPATPFRVEEASIADVHDAIRSGTTTCAEVVQGYIERARAYNGVCTTLVTPTARGRAARSRRGARRSAAALPHADTVAVTDLVPDFAELQRRCAGLRPHGADGVRPDGHATVRHGRRHPERRPGERARDAEHSRRALRHLQRRVRRASVDGPAAGRRAGRVRGVPQAARRARARGRARSRCTAATPISRRCRSTASRCRSRPSTTRRTCARRAAATSTTPPTSRRPIRRSSRGCATPAPSSTPKRTTPSTTAAAAIRAATRKSSTRCSRRGGARETWGGRDLQPLRHVAPNGRLERRLGRFGCGQPRRLLDLRIDGRLVPQPRHAQRRRHVRADEGHDLVRRRHRRRSVPRPARHQLPHGRRHGDGARRVPRSEPPAASSTRATSTRRCRARSLRRPRTSARSASRRPRSRSPACASASIRELMVKSEPGDAAIVDTIERRARRCFSRSARSSSNRRGRATPTIPQFRT